MKKYRKCTQNQQNHRTSRGGAAGVGNLQDRSSSAQDIVRVPVCFERN